jgi:hypothetical protein
MRPNVGWIDRTERSRLRAGVDSTDRRRCPSGPLPTAFLGLAEREGIAITQRYGRRGVAAAEPDAYLERCRIAPGNYSPVSVHYKGRHNAAEVRHLDLLDAVETGLSWSDTRLAREVGVDAETVAPWRFAGVPNSYLPALRALRDATGKRRVDRLDLASLLPWGSRCRLEQVRTAGGASHGSGEGPARLVGRETHRLSGHRSR